MPYLRSLALCTLFAALTIGCDDEPAPQAVQAPQAAPVNVTEPQVIVSAGPHQFRVEPHASGHVYAYPGQTLVEPMKATILVDVPIEGGTRPVEMRWNNRQRRYEGRATGVTIIPGSLVLHLTVDEILYVGTNVIVVVLPAVVVVRQSRGKHKHKHRGH